MGDVTTAPTFLDNLRERLLLRPGLAGVNCFTAEVFDKEAGREAIVFGVEPVPGEFSYRTMPKKQVTESYVVEGRTWVVKPGSGETVIKAARDRAFAIFGEVVTELVDCNTASGTQTGTEHCQATLGVDDASITTFKLNQFVQDGARDCRVLFTIAVTAKFTPA